MVWGGRRNEAPAEYPSSFGVLADRAIGTKAFLAGALLVTRSPSPGR
jgi:hypothetical protein